MFHWFLAGHGSVCTSIMASGILMTNDVTDTNPEEAVPCIALSKNDSYVMSASGGKVSLFNMMTFKVSFLSPYSMHPGRCILYFVWASKLRAKALENTSHLFITNWVL